MVRNNDTKIKLTKDEKILLGKRADKLGLKISQYIRMICLDAIVNTEFKKKKD